LHLVQHLGQLDIVMVPYVPEEPRLAEARRAAAQNAVFGVFFAGIDPHRSLIRHGVQHLLQQVLFIARFRCYLVKGHPLETDLQRQPRLIGGHLQAEELQECRGDRHADYMRIIPVDHLCDFLVQLFVFHWRNLL
jgi:hypothetical protein